MAVQERNSEMVSLLSVDFIRKNDSAYTAGLLMGAMTAMPGLVALWPMTVSLSDVEDWFPNYAYLPGRAGGQILNGGTAPGEDLTLRSTANATKGSIVIGEASTALSLDAAGTVSTRGTNKILGYTEQWTTDLWGKSIELTEESAIQWKRVGGSYSRGLAYTASGSLTFMRSTANDTSAVAIYDMTLSDAGALQPWIAGEGWTNLSFWSGWGNYGGDYQVGQFKKFGDLVFIRGLVARPSGTSTTIAVLPLGYRPPARCLFGVHTDLGLGTDRIDILTDGSISLSSGGTTFLQLDGLVFSII